MKNKIILAFIFVLAAVSACVCLTSCTDSSPAPEYPAYSNPDEAEHLMETKYIIHAAGRLGNNIQTAPDGGAYEFDMSTTFDGANAFDGSNAMEGLINSYENGQRVIELDFNFTSDGSLACIHDWYRQYSSAITDYVPLSLEEFLNCKIYDLYTPVWLGSLVDFLNEHEDVYIVTDIKDNNISGAAAIAEYCPELKNRFIVQIYDKSEYDAVRELGFEYIIFTLYRLDWHSKTDTKALAEFAKSHPLIGYTFSYELCSVDGYVEGMKKAKIPLFIHTINGADEQQKYFDMGITGIYTDIAESTN